MVQKNLEKSDLSEAHLQEFCVKKFFFKKENFFFAKINFNCMDYVSYLIGAFVIIF